MSSAENICRENSEVSVVCQVERRGDFAGAEKCFTGKTASCILPSLRRGDREAEGARLEIVCTARYRGFESPPLRQILHPNGTMLPPEVTAGSRATDGRQPRQARKGAAVTTSPCAAGVPGCHLWRQSFFGALTALYPDEEHCLR